MDVAARAATASDLDVLGELAEIAIDELRPLRGGELWYRQSSRPAPAIESLRSDLADEASAVVVGTIDDTIVGYGVLRVDEMQTGAPLGVVTDLFTLADARGVGVGEAMMNHLIDDATTRGCTGVDSLALPGDRHTKNFFESFGLVARAIIVHRSLTSPDEGDDAET